jgi:hypothetical protein
MSEESFPPTEISSGFDLLRSTIEAYTIGRVEHLRVNLEFFLEEISRIPSRTFPEQFGGILTDAENLLIDIKTALNRTTGTPPHLDITDDMVEAAKRAMPWEGSSIPEEEQSRVMRDVLQKALSNNKSDSPILL